MIFVFLQWFRNRERKRERGTASKPSKGNAVASQMSGKPAWGQPHPISAWPQNKTARALASGPFQVSSVLGIWIFEAFHFILYIHIHIYTHIYTNYIYIIFYYLIHEKISNNTQQKATTGIYCLHLMCSQMFPSHFPWPSPERSNRDLQTHQGSIKTPDMGQGRGLCPDIHGSWMLPACCLCTCFWSSPILETGCRGYSFRTYKVHFLMKTGSNQVIYFQKQPVSLHFQPLLAVSWGAGLQGQLLPFFPVFMHLDKGTRLGGFLGPLWKISEAGSFLKESHRSNFTTTTPLACKSLFLKAAAVPGI